MERLFERHVEVLLGKQLPSGAKLLPQRSRHSLCTHRDEPMFRLKPDLLLEHRGRTWVLDSKWKLIDAAARERNYGLSQADFYQLYAYGQTHLQGQGEMALIYPRTERFREPLKPFAFSEQLRLWVLPFDLLAGELLGGERVGLPLGC
ncbi:McrC family protein [Geopseudomonas aromaticivorans]|nr:McrC family protein [Pseudomonas aromaticivorans]